MICKNLFFLPNGMNFKRSNSSFHTDLCMIMNEKCKNHREKRYFVIISASVKRMHFYKGCVVLFVTLVNTFQIHGILEIHFPANNVGNYGESTHMNCTDTTIDVTNGYNWYKDTVVIYNSVNGDTGRYKSSHGGDYFTLEITNTQLTDNGVYQCNYNFQDQSDTLEIQAKGEGVGEVVDDKLKITLTRFYPVTTTVSSVNCNGKTITGSITSTKNESDSFLTLVWTSSNNVDPSDLKAGCDASISSRTTYSIQVTFKEECTCDCKCKKKCTRIVIPSIVFGCLGVINLPIVSGGAVSGFLGRTTALVVDSIGIVCDVISSVLGIVVQVEDCCEDAADCCEDDSDCCEDSNCCKDECERNWVENTGAAFIAIGVLVGILAGFIFHRVWSNRMGPGNNAYKAKEAKDPGENHGMTGTSM